jgi:hypothetical protein
MQMITYCYSVDGEPPVEREFPRGEAPSEITLEDGRVAARDYRAELQPTHSSGSGWPFACYASGVQPEQRKELQDYLAKKGVPTEVNRNGDPIYRNINHRRAALKARGMFDRSSFD